MTTGASVCSSDTASLGRAATAAGSVKSLYARSSRATTTSATVNVPSTEPEASTTGAERTCADARREEARSTVSVGRTVTKPGREGVEAVRWARKVESRVAARASLGVGIEQTNEMLRGGVRRRTSALEVFSWFVLSAAHSPPRARPQTPMRPHTTLRSLRPPCGAAARTHRPSPPCATPPPTDAPSALVELTKRVAAHSRAGRADAAVAAVVEAEVAPDVRLATAVLDACASGRRPDLAATAFDSLFSTGLAPDGRAYTALLRAYVSVDPPRWADAARALSGMSGRGVSATAASYNVLLAAASAAKDVDRGAAVLTQMKAAGVAPDGGTVAAVARRRLLRSALKKTFGVG